MSNAILDGTVQDQNGVAVPGALVYVFDGRGESGGLSLLYDSMGQAISNPVTTDDDGYWSAYAATDRFYTFSIYWGGRKRYVEANVLLGTLGISTDPNLRADLASSTAGKGAALVAFADGRTVADVRAAADITLYSDESTGSDTTGTGASGAKFATVQKAIDAATPFLTARQTVKIVVTGNVTTNPRTTGGASGQMERASLIYIDGVKIGKRTDIPGGVMTGGLILDLSGATLKPSADFPIGIYCTGHSGSVGIIGGATDPQAGAEILLTAHRGCYVHVNGGTWDGGGICSIGFYAEAGGMIEAVDATVTNNTRDIDADIGSLIQLSAPGGTATTGTIGISGQVSLAVGMQCTGAITNRGVLLFAGTAGSPVVLSGNYDGQGGIVNGAYVNHTGTSASVVARGELWKIDSFKFDCQLSLNGGAYILRGSTAYTTGAASTHAIPVIYAQGTYIDNTSATWTGSSVSSPVALPNIDRYQTVTVTANNQTISVKAVQGARNFVILSTSASRTGCKLDVTLYGDATSTPATTTELILMTLTGNTVQLVNSAPNNLLGVINSSIIIGTAAGAYPAATFVWQSTYGSGGGWYLTATPMPSRQTGWTAGTGTANLGAFAADAGATISASYVQAEAQATRDAAKAASQRVLALEQALRNIGIIN